LLLQLAGGGTKEAAEAAEAGDIEALPIDEKYKALLRLCVKLTEHAYKVTDDDIDALRAAGLGDDDILEGVFVACLFNAIDRLADTFGLYELMQLREQ
jgi:alkylhydroperoxidase family enzyme